MCIRWLLFFTNESQNPFVFVVKIQFFSSAGNVIQQIKKCGLTVMLSFSEFYADDKWQFFAGEQPVAELLQSERHPGARGPAAQTLPTRAWQLPRPAQPQPRQHRYYGTRYTCFCWFGFFFFFICCEKSPFWYHLFWTSLDSANGF